MVTGPVSVEKFVEFAPSLHKNRKKKKEKQENVRSTLGQVSKIKMHHI
jgi:hypothetical protein